MNARSLGTSKSLNQVYRETVVRINDAKQKLDAAISDLEMCHDIYREVSVNLGSDPKYDTVHDAQLRRVLELDPKILDDVSAVLDDFVRNAKNICGDLPAGDFSRAYPDSVRRW
jgi:hypothetical protein